MVITQNQDRKKKINTFYSFLATWFHHKNFSLAVMSMGPCQVLGVTKGLNENTIAKFPNYFALTDNHKEYCFAGLHFHWGTLDKTSSEHLVDGEKRIKYILTLYSDHASAGTTLEQFETGDDVITAFFDIVFDIVDDLINPAFGIILNTLTLNNIMFNSNNTFIYDFDLSQLIPDRVNTERYYAYKGNLTTPPCTNIGMYLFFFVRKIG